MIAVTYSSILGMDGNHPVVLFCSSMTVICTSIALYAIDMRSWRKSANENCFFLVFLSAIRWYPYRELRYPSPLLTPRCSCRMP